MDHEKRLWIECFLVARKRGSSLNESALEAASSVSIYRVWARGVDKPRTQDVGVDKPRTWDHCVYCAGSGMRDVGYDKTSICNQCNGSGLRASNGLNF